MRAALTNSRQRPRCNHDIEFAGRDGLFAHAAKPEVRAYPLDFRNRCRADAEAADASVSNDRVRIHVGRATAQRSGLTSRARIRTPRDAKPIQDSELGARRTQLFPGAVASTDRRGIFLTEHLVDSGWR